MTCRSAALFVTALCLGVAAAGHDDPADKYMRHHYSSTTLARDLRLAQVPYCVQQPGRTDLCPACPFGVYVVADIESGEARAIVGFDKADDTVVVSFRGSASPVLFAQNTFNESKKMACLDDDGGAAVGCRRRAHRPYLDLYDDLLDENLVGTVRSVAATVHMDHVKVVGHSLGAALATLFAYDVVRGQVGPLVLQSLTTFGSPRVVNRATINYFEEAATDALVTRIYRRDDPVAFFPTFNTAATRRLGAPLRADMPFFHVGHSVALPPSTDPAPPPLQPASEFKAHAAYGAVVFGEDACPDDDEVEVPWFDDDLCWH